MCIDWDNADPIGRLSHWPDGTPEEDKQRHVFEDRPDYVELDKKSKRAQQKMAEEEEARQKKLLEKFHKSMEAVDVDKMSIYSIGSELPDPSSSRGAASAWLRLLGASVARDIGPSAKCDGGPSYAGDLALRAERSMGESLGRASLCLPVSAIDARPDADEPVFFLPRVDE